MPTSASNESSRWPARALPVTFRAILSGVPGGALAAILPLEPFDQARHVYPHYLADAVVIAVPLAAAGVLIWAGLYRAARTRLGERIASLAATALLFAPFAALFALRVNQIYLPDVLEPRSLAGNAGMLVAAGVLGLVLTWVLRRWQEGPFERGPARPLPVAVAALVPLAIYFDAQRSSGPDVVVILIDVLRADHLGCYGYERPTSPNIDALAEESILFEDVVAPSTYTKTSIASLFTGLNAYNHGVYLGTFGVDPTTVESDTIDEGLTTLAEQLYAHDYNTAAWVQNGQLRAFMGYDQGFTFYRDQPGNIETIANEFASWHAEWSRTQRYFAYLHCIDVHAPYHPPEPYAGRFGPPGSLASDMDDSSWYEFKGKVARREVILTEADIELFESRYDELIAYVDHQVGRILDDLRASGRYDDTLIVITSDHGEGFWEHEFISHSNVPFQELAHVPMIVKLPGSTGAGRRVKSLVGLVDLGPTILEYVGAPVPRGMDGESFLPLLEGAEALPDPRWRYVEFRDQIAIRTERWKYLTRGNRPPRLFDLQADPGETRDCIDEHPEVAARFEAAVDAARSMRRRSADAPRVTLDAETLRSLEDLGYL